MRSVGTYPTYSCSLVLSAHRAIHRHTVYTSFVGSFAENDCRFVFNKYEFLSIYRQTNGRYIDMTTHLDMPPLIKIHTIKCTLFQNVESFTPDPTLKQIVTSMSLTDVPLDIPVQTQRIWDFFLLLTLCNTVVVSLHGHQDKVKLARNSFFYNTRKSDFHVYLPLLLNPTLV